MGWFSGWSFVAGVWFACGVFALTMRAFALYDYWLRRRATALSDALNRMVQPQHRALVSLVADAVIVDVYRQADNHLWFHQFERRALWGNPRDLALDIVAMMERKEAS